MGIPSYYKRLCDTVPGLLQKKCNETVENFYLDFNCLIYYCIRRQGTSLGSYEGESTRIAWEDRLIYEVGRYVQQLVETVQPTALVYLAIDGVVPLSKMRQQRLRRFKSHWMHEQEVAHGKPNMPRWDTNSITPGTAFMERLSTSLKILCKQKTATTEVRWELSDATEPGEGEQKVFARIRSMRSLLTSAQVVYGLDADLIVLSLLESMHLKAPLWLFREAMECGVIKKTAFGEEYRYLNIHMLASYSTRSEGTDTGRNTYLMNYCMGMSLLGNDFLPHGIGLTMKHGGHEALLELLKDLKLAKKTLIYNGAWSLEGLRFAFSWLAVREESAVCQMLQSKHLAKTHPIRVDPGAEPWVADVERWMRSPAHSFVEHPLLQSMTGYGKDIQIQLQENWRDSYERLWIGIEGPNDSHRVCSTYREGLQWILAYYTGQPCSPTWMFPWQYPPTWASLVFDTNSSCLEATPVESSGFVAPQEQLALVLPKESYWLIRTPRLRDLPNRAPQLWCKSFSVSSAGRSLQWECEASIPLFTPERMRFLLQSVSS